MSEQETIKALKKQLLVKDDAITDALLKLEKACLLLNKWIQDYSFYEKPDPGLIFSRHIPSDNTKKSQSIAWYWEYDTIRGYINIVDDYANECRELLENIVKSEEAV